MAHPACIYIETGLETIEQVIENANATKAQLEALYKALNCDDMGDGGDSGKEKP